MTAILAIDAAWTARQPSGVALVRNTRDTWRCVGLAPSYIQFEHLAAGDPDDSDSKPTGSRPDLDRLLAVCRRLLDGEQVSLIAMDMPLSLLPITRRRAADDAVSRAYGNKGCAVHSPSAARPGRLADEVRARAATLGFPLATASKPAGTCPALIEVYPHPALIHLLGRNFRIPYKVAKTTRYWCDATLQERIARLREQHTRILSALGERIVDLPLQLPGKAQIGSLTSLKAYEDTLDALVCAWVGIRYLQRDCRAFGDRNAAIWIPTHAGGRGVTTTCLRRT
jgi:predicted RNase H-like nuclease